MKHLAKICTSALTFGALMLAGSTVASAHHVNSNQQSNSDAQVVNHNVKKSYPLYHFQNDQNNFQTNLKTAQHTAKRYLIRQNVTNYKVSHHHLTHHPDYSEDNNVAANSNNNSNKTYTYQGNNYTTKDSYRAARFANSKMGKLAKSKLGDPYVWGATGANAFDCSGFTQYLYRNAKHINIPRTAGAQYEYGKHVSYNHIKPGNLVFFGASPAAISHVGMYVGNGKMIDAQNYGVIIENVKAPWWNLVGCAKVRRNLDLD